MKRWIPSPQIHWRAEGTRAEVDPRLLSLLTGIAAHGALAEAANDAGMSYRHAWALLQPWVVPLPNALVKLQRGEGAKLTNPGVALLQSHRLLSERLAVAAQSWLGEAEPVAEAPTIRHDCVASHDLLIVRLPEFTRAQGLELDIAFRGSGEAIAALAEGRAALAGFHVPIGALGALRRQMVAPLVPLRDVRVVRLFMRTQGLMVRAASKRRILSLGDLAKRDIRFVNRQRGSGTRQVFDALLAAARIDPRRIDGYAREEFTHAAVAATVAAGSADAGFGIAAAAAQFDLAFVPLARESYAVALRRDLIDASAEHALLQALRAPAWRALVTTTTGYALPSRVSASPIRAN